VTYITIQSRRQALFECPCDSDTEPRAQDTRTPSLFRPSRAHRFLQSTGGSLSLTPGYVSLAPPGPDILQSRAWAGCPKSAHRSPALLESSPPRDSQAVSAGGATDSSPGFALAHPGLRAPTSSSPGGAKETKTANCRSCNTHEDRGETAVRVGGAPGKPVRRRQGRPRLRASLPPAQHHEHRQLPRRAQ